MKTVEEVAAELNDAKVLRVLDATSGFWHMKLDKKSSELGDISTPGCHLVLTQPLRSFKRE